MKRFFLFLALAASIWTAATARPFKLAALTAMERSFDQRLERLSDDPYLLVGLTRGVYLEGYGAVFTAEVSLANGLAPNPFRPAITKEDIIRVHAKKLERLPALRQCMRDMLLAAAASLDDVPAGEQIVVGVSLLYRPEEDRSGMPGQILMQGAKARLLEAKLGRISLEQAVKSRDY
ncbi:MAG TPA: hypothetical protein VL285_26455 [Bryobacteraceae bacterium]|nr:hypothetical protein [Bryobacteraceae bacterium]